MKLKLFFTEGLPAELNKVRVVRERNDLSALREHRELRKDCLGSLVIASDQKVVQNERHRLMLFQVTVQSRQPERQVELITGTIAQALHGDLGLVGPDAHEHGEVESDPNPLKASRVMDWKAWPDFWRSGP